MKAAVVTDFGKPLEILDRPTPEPGPGQVLVRMEASGLCHTDIHAAHGDWPVKPEPPFVPGHEGVGPVAALGAGVPKALLAKRVAVPWLGSSCDACRYCVPGWETLCESQANSGYSVDGCYAEYAVANAGAVVPVPDGVSSFDAAPLTCAGVTTYKAIKVARVVPFEATFKLKITDAAGRTAADVQVTATSGSGTRGTFDVTIPYRATRSGAGLLTAYWNSPEDGHAVVEDTVPLTVQR